NDYPRIISYNPPPK
ncbi:Cytoplasmic protein, partial [Monkeypox virus]